MRAHRPPRSSRSFTLVEAIVVLIIIAILMAIAQVAYHFLWGMANKSTAVSATSHVSRILSGTELFTPGAVQPVYAVRENPEPGQDLIANQVWAADIIEEVDAVRVLSDGSVTVLANGFLCSAASSSQITCWDEGDALAQLESLTASPGDEQVVLDWQEAVSALGQVDVDSYEVSVKSGDEWESLGHVEPEYTQVAVAGLMNGEPYEFTVVAHTIAGDGDDDWAESEPVDLDGSDYVLSSAVSTGSSGEEDPHLECLNYKERPGKANKNDGKDSCLCDGDAGKGNDSRRK